MNWVSNLQGIFQAMEEHSGLRTFIVDPFAPKIMSDYNLDDEDGPISFSLDDSVLE